ncbi:MAG TPA: hypothetical protein VLG12_05475 [Candidatus Saccharimonadales bacterium]|nr:hypothetical protein [Candidatus Saccharimonadales bacterium]
MKKKKVIRNKLWKYPTRGKSELPILLGVIGFGVILAGGLLSSYHPGTYPYQSLNAYALCCDSGNGDACHPSQQQTFTYTDTNGTTSTYGLLKSSITLTEGGNHLLDTGQKYNGDTIVKNVSDGYKQSTGDYECGHGANDQLWDTRNGKKCVAIPDDELMYVCRKNCPATSIACNLKATGEDPTNGADTTCFGDKTTIFDVYFRLSDDPNPGVPDVIKNCEDRSTAPVTISEVPKQTVMPAKPYPSHPSLQLHTFLFASPVPQAGASTMVSPYCKPAIYLYPPIQEAVNVKIAPKGDIQLTIPQYSTNGWNVLANPTGDISYNNKDYDYLFYEAKIPDSLLSEQKTGYVIAYNDLSSFFENILPKLGLNTKEQQQFSDYWLKALPKNPYYLISIVPQTALNQISPLTISPQPQTIIRVTLSFKPLDKKIDIAAPFLPAIQREGFTVVEWGGLFKQDKNHPFTCLM